MTAQTITQAVEKRDAGIISVMWARKTHFAAVLPEHVDVKSFLGTAAAALYASAGSRSPTLMEAAESDPDSLITAMMRCAALGHQPGTDEFYLPPRKVKGRPSVLGIEGYRGIVERMYRSGAVRSVIVREVCAKDRFRYVEGRDDKPEHSFGGGDGHYDQTGADFFGPDGSRSRGAMVGVYAYAILMTGAVSRVAILNRDDVLAARDAGGYSPDDHYSPWNRLDAGKDHPEFTGRSMWWKTAARRLEPWVPTSAEYRREQLRAAVQTAGPVAQPPAPGTHVRPEPVYEAEVIEDPGPAVPDGTPGSGPVAGPRSGPPGPTGHANGARSPAPPGDASVTGASSEPPDPTGGRDVRTDAPTAAATAAPASPAAAPSALSPKPQPAGKAALERMASVLRSLPLGEEEDVTVLLIWLAGAEWTATAQQVKIVNSFLDDHLKAAAGDVAEAAHRIWQQYHDAHVGQDGGAP